MARSGYCPVFVIAFLYLTAASAGLAQEKYTSKEMLADCQQIIRSTTKNGDSDNVELENDFPSGTCWGAFLSLQQLMVMKIEGSKSSLLQICAPPAATLVQLIRLFDVYARVNADIQNEPFTIAAISALRAAYPCKK
jgi:hypothetical protein